MPAWNHPRGSASGIECAGDIPYYGAEICRSPDLEAADEVCITSTTRDLLPAREIAGKSLLHRGDIRDRVTTAFRSLHA